jgi:hypothetical protein
MTLCVGPITARGESYEPDPDATVRGGDHEPPNGSVADLIAIAVVHSTVTFPCGPTATDGLIAP